MTRSSALPPIGVVISLTSHHHRVRFSHLAIESIIFSGAGESSIHLWLPLGSPLSPSLRRLQSRGLNIHIVQDVRSHTKWAYLYGLGDLASSRGAVLADDDLIYPKHWLKEILNKVNEDAHAPVVTLSALLAENSHGHLSFEASSAGDLPENAERVELLNHPFSGSGFFIPAHVVTQINRNQEEYLHLCPTSDDIWLHRELYRMGLPIRVIGTTTEMPPSNPFMGASGLHNINWNGGQNEEQLRNAFAGIYQP